MSISGKATHGYRIFYLHETGFTLIEMLVTITILAIIAMIAVPSITASLKGQEAKTVSSTLRTFIHNGQQHTLIQQQPITLCIADITNKCVKKNGTILLSFIDKNNNQKFDEGTDVVLEKTALTPKYGYLDLRTGRNTSVILLAAGTGQALGYMGHIKYCPTDNSDSNKFKIEFGKLGYPTYTPNTVEATSC